MKPQWNPDFLPGPEETNADHDKAQKDRIDAYKVLKKYRKLYRELKGVNGAEKDRDMLKTWMWAIKSLIKIHVENMKVGISVSDDMTKGYKRIQVPFYQLHEVIKAEACYSAIDFKQGYRHTKNFKDGNTVVILDVDDGMTIEEAKQMLAERDLKALLITTKSHQKQKGDHAPCDRFRIILPTIVPFKGTPADFKNMMVNIFEYFDGVSDEATKDSARFYYGNKDSKYWYVDGNPLNITNFYFTKETEKPSYSGPTKRSDSGIINYFVDKCLMTGNTGNRDKGLWDARVWAEKNDRNSTEFLWKINNLLPVPKSDAEMARLLRPGAVNA